MHMHHGWRLCGTLHQGKVSTISITPSNIGIDPIFHPFLSSVYLLDHINWIMAQLVWLFDQTAFNNSLSFNCFQACGLGCKRSINENGRPSMSRHEYNIPITCTTNSDGFTRTGSHFEVDGANGTFIWIQNYWMKLATTITTVMFGLFNLVIFIPCRQLSFFYYQRKQNADWAASPITQCSSFLCSNLILERLSSW